MTPFCICGILWVHLTIPIVAFCSQLLVYVRNFPSLCMKQFLSYLKHRKLRTSFEHQYQKLFSVSSNLLQITKLWVNLKPAILRCSAVIPNAVIGETSAVFNLAVVGCIGVLKLLSMS